MITVFDKPIFKINLRPYGIISVPVCSKSTWDTLIYAMSTLNRTKLYEAAKALYPDLPENIPDVSVIVFLDEYMDQVEEYCKINIDIFGIPEKPDFDKTEEKLKLPIITYNTHIVQEYTGLDFERINELDILDFRMLLADAVKVIILRRADGKGTEYLNECYNFMHKISNMFD